MFSLATPATGQKLWTCDGFNDEEQLAGVFLCVAEPTMVWLRDGKVFVGRFPISVVGLAAETGKVAWQRTELISMTGRYQLGP